MVDTRGLSCPMPVIMVQKAVRKDAPAKLEVLADARVAVENITRFARTQGYQVAVTEDGPEFKLTLTK
nr:sulfurtransferase TusA family protein [uncultured Oscillibacter sp.]